MFNKRKTAGFMSLLIILAMLFVPLTACSGDDTVDVSTDVTTEAPKPGDPVKLENSPVTVSADTVILCTDKDNGEMVALAKELVGKIQEKTGLELKVETGSTDKANKIVLGYDKDDADCEAAYALIKGEDHSVYSANSKIILAARTNAALKNSTELLLNTALAKEGDAWIVNSYSVNYEDNVELSKYRLVYSENASDYIKNKAALHLRSSIKKKFGVELELVSDATAPAEYEILIGDTNRQTESVKAQKDNIRSQYSIKTRGEMTYGCGIVRDGSKIHLLSKDDKTLFSAVGTFCESVAADIGPVVFCPDANSYFPSVADTEDDMALAAGADIRVMSYNILTSNYAQIAEKNRDLRVANVIMYYMPDVIALQECEGPWHDALAPLVVNNGMYKKACETSNGGKPCMTTFLYNPKTVKLVKQNIVDIVEKHDVRVLSVGVFERLADGSRFVVTNFHPAPSGDRVGYLQHFKKLFDVFEDEMKQYEGLPLIMMGDFNTKEQDDMYKKIKANLDVKDAKYEADVLVRDYCTYLDGGPYGTIRKGNENCLDHIFVNDKVETKLFNVVIDHDVKNASDHLPIYADISFVK